MVEIFQTSVLSAAGVGADAVLEAGALEAGALEAAVLGAAVLELPEFPQAAINPTTITTAMMIASVRFMFILLKIIAPILTTFFPYLFESVYTDFRDCLLNCGALFLVYGYGYVGTDGMAKSTSQAGAAFLESYVFISARIGFPRQLHAFFGADLDAQKASLAEFAVNDGVRHIIPPILPTENGPCLSPQGSYS
jgi:hypothetical protein